MNPYDAINHDTKRNTDSKRKRIKKPIKQKKSVKKKSQKATQKNSKRNKGIITNQQKKQLKKSYSTDRINVYVLLHLKALQIISGNKSRSDLEEKMIRIVEPTIINSPGKRTKYYQLLKYAVKGFELKNKMK